MKKFIEVALIFAILLLMASTGRTQYHSTKTDPGNNNPPPAGALLDLNGLPIPGGGNSTYQQYTVDFTASIESTAITFAFREDPAYISFTNVSVTDNAVPNGPNLLQNGDFSGGTYTNNGNPLTPNFWIFSNQYGATASGVVQSGTGECYTASFCWFDGSVQAYDAISQTIPTIIGHTYHIVFSVADNSQCGTCTFSDLSTNGDNTSPGGNGKNVTVYAQGGLPPAGSSQTVNVVFSPSTTPETQVATVNNPEDPNANQSLALTLASVTNALNVSVTFFYERTDLSTGTNGVGVADGVCEAGANETQDFDCRLALDFTYQQLPNGDKVVPHIFPSHDNLGVWERVVATRVSDGMPAVAGFDYAASVDWYYAWNANPSLIPVTEFAVTNTAAAAGFVNPEYPTGWNNQNPQFYDRPGENLDIAFVKNITTFSKNCAITSCVGTADPGVGGHTITLNDVVAAAPPNPPAGTTLGTVELKVPVPGISPFPYFKGLPMLVAFQLEKESTETSIANALTPPHSVSVGTLDAAGNNVPVQFPRGFPTTFTYNPYLKTYYIFLSPAPYTPGTKYTLQINSDLFPAPVTATFVVKRDFF
jgi:hypothetical protein